MEPQGLRRSLAERDVLTGLMLGFAAPTLVELAAVGGFDVIIVDTEHGALGPESVENLLRAATASGIRSLVRVSANERAPIQWALDAGADGVQIPMVETADEAARAVAFARYGPEGARGLAANRGCRYAPMSAAEVAAANARVAVVVQIETAAGVRNAAAIAAVPGIDAIFVGPSDLSQSLGRPGELAAPEVQEAIRGVQEVAGGTPCGILVRNPTEYTERVSQGFVLLETAANALVLKAFRDFRAGSGGDASGVRQPAQGVLT